MTQMKYNDGSAYLAKLTEAAASGDTEYVRRNLPRLKWMIARLRRRQSETAALLTRAQCLIEAVGRPQTAETIHE